MINRRNILKSILFSIMLLPYVKSFNFIPYKEKTIKIKKSDNYYWILSSDDL